MPRRTGAPTATAARRGIARFAEVFVDTPLEVCAARDPKGLYRNKEATTLPGVQAAYEPPLAPELVVAGDAGTPDESAARVLGLLERAAGSGLLRTSTKPSLIKVSRPRFSPIATASSASGMRALKHSSATRLARRLAEASISSFRSICERRTGRDTARRSRQDERAPRANRCSRAPRIGMAASFMSSSPSGLSLLLDRSWARSPRHAHRKNGSDALPRSRHGL